MRIVRRGRPGAPRAALATSCNVGGCIHAADDAACRAGRLRENVPTYVRNKSPPRRQPIECSEPHNSGTQEKRSPCQSDSYRWPASASRIAAFPPSCPTGLSVASAKVVRAPSAQSRSSETRWRSRPRLAVRSFFFTQPVSQHGRLQFAKIWASVSNLVRCCRRCRAAGAARLCVSRELARETKTPARGRGRCAVEQWTLSALCVVGSGRAARACRVRKPFSVSAGYMEVNDELGTASSARADKATLVGAALPPE